MPRYRKKPVEIEAMLLPADATPTQAMEVYQWVERNTLGSFEPLDVIEGRKPYPESGVSIDPRDGRIIISTLEGLHWVDTGDYVIRGVAGEFYPCKPDIFAATYEAATAVPAAPEAETTTRVFAALHRSAEQDVSRVIDLYERWVKAGPPPLGTSVARWWDARLVELHDAIQATTAQDRA